MKEPVAKRREARRRRDPAPDDGETSSALNPVRARREGRTDRKFEDESNEFRERAQWWQLYHGDRSGVVSGELRVQALALAAEHHANGLDNRDPGGGRPRRGVELLHPLDAGAKRDRVAPQAATAPNPRPRSSAGFASEAIDVRGVADLAAVTLKIGLDPKLLLRVDPATVRVFVFDADSSEWQLIVRSGVNAESGYAWAHLQRPGLYVAIGLPADVEGLVALSALRTLMPRVRAAPDRAARRRVLALIAELLASPRQSRRAAAGGAFDPGRLDIGARGLPEFDLLDELGSPPMWTHPMGKLLIERIRWSDLAVDVDSIVWFRDWCSAGPTNVSGRIKSLQIHPVEGNGVLAGAADGGVWRTQDGGGTWFPLMSQELSLAIGAVARSSANLTVIYAATGEDTPGWAPSYPGVGVYRSDDGGNSWRLLAPIASTRCTRLLLHPTNADIVYVAGSGGLHKSIDGGASWTNVRSDHVSDALMDPVHPDTIYAAVWSSGIFRSKDGGGSWSDFNAGLPTGPAADWIKLAASERAVDGSVTLVAKMGTDSGLLFRCRVHIPPVIFRGKKTRRDVVLPDAPDFDTPWQPLPGVHEPASYNEWTDLVAIDPKRTNVIFAGGIGLQRSGDGGASFAQITGTHSDHHVLAFAHSNNDLCYMACDGGVYRSVDNGRTWTLRSTGLVATQLYSIGVSQQLTPFLLGGATQDQGIIKTTGPAAWSDTGAGNEGGFFIVDPNNGNNVYVTPWDGNLRRSTDGGNHWQTILNGITQAGMPPAAVTIRHLAVCPGNARLLICAGGSEVFRSTDQGDSWTSVATFADGVATRVTWETTTTCYAASSAGAVLRSTQQGSAGTWSPPYADSAKPPGGVITSLAARAVTWDIATAKSAAAPVAHAGRRARAFIGGIVAFPFRFDLVYIAHSYGGRVYKSTDAGAHWINASGSGAGALPNIPISALVIDLFLSDTVYAATDIGVFRTRDAGVNWEPFSDGLPRVVVSDMKLRAASNTLYCSTMGRGAWQRALS